MCKQKMYVKQKTCINMRYTPFVVRYNVFLRNFELRSLKWNMK